MIDSKPHVVYIGLRLQHLERLDFARYTFTLILDRHQAAHLPPHVRALFAAVGVIDAADGLDFDGYERAAPSMISMVEQWSRQWDDPVAVIGIHEHTTLPAAMLRDRFKVPGVNTHTAELFRDKVLMKAALAGSGLRIPRFLPVDSDLDVERLQEFLGQFTGPVVLKPRRQAGSFGVRIFQDADELLAYASVNAFEDGYEVEEFIDGTVCHFDGVVRDGEVRFLSPSQYAWNALDYRNEGAAVATLTFNDDAQVAAAGAFVERVLKSLGLYDSTFHIEAFLLSTGEFVFLEAASRYGGAWVVPHISKVYGVDLTWESVLACLNEPSTLREPRQITDTPHVGASGWLIAPLPATRRCEVRRIHGLDALPESVIAADVPNIGDVLNEHAAAYGGSGKFIFAAATADEIRRDMQLVIDRFRVDVSELV
ncbi:ATP-grasp domain-containing protein [Micromonospora sp. DT53]|uniref:ATP-grasp domain-containing protein n=1 Tax=Micromonospora sp. DT53 TaxID=3393444 RepID=UPI003CE97545